MPIAVSAYSTAALQNSGATDIRQMAQLAPSLIVSSHRIGSQCDRAPARHRHRRRQPRLESSVAVFIDGVYRSRTGSGLNDRAKSSASKCCVGRRARCRAATRRGCDQHLHQYPEFKFGGYGEASYGNYDAVRLAGALTGPIIADKLAFRIDGVYGKRDGFLHDVVNNTDFNNRNRYFVRGQLFWKPSSDFSVRLIGDYTHRDEKCCGAVYIDTREKFDPTPGVPGDFSIASQNRIVSILQSLGGVLPSMGNPYNRQIAQTKGRPIRTSPLTARSRRASAGRWATCSSSRSAPIANTRPAARATCLRQRRHRLPSQRRQRLSPVQDLHAGNPPQRRPVQQPARLAGRGYYAHEDLDVVDNLRFGSQYGAFAACRAVATVNPAAALRDPTASGCLSAAAAPC